MFRARPFLPSLLLACVLLFVVGLIPASLWPWSPLDVMAPVTPLTWLKLRLLAADDALCEAALRSAPFPVAHVPDRPWHGVADACGLKDAVRVHAGSVALSSSFLASCPLAVDWAMFVVHAVQPAGQKIFGRPVVRIDHLGSYDCRDIAGTDRISAHATANAIDVAAFRIAGGPSVAVADWDEAGRAREFLHRVRDGACRYFGTVLSPDFNRAHAGHFHLQATGLGFCG